MEESFSRFKSCVETIGNRKRGCVDLAVKFYLTRDNLCGLEPSNRNYRISDLSASGEGVLQMRIGY